MNETLKTIAERYSCRDFADTPLSGKAPHELDPAKVTYIGADS